MAATSAPGQAQEKGRGIEALEQRLARTPLDPFLAPQYVIAARKR